MIQTDVETALLETIKNDFPAAFWKRLRFLRKRLEAETITEAELAESIDMCNKMEAENVDRLRAVIELSKLRGISFDEMCKELKIYEHRPNRN